MADTREIVSLCEHLDGYSPDAIAKREPIRRFPGERYQMDIERIPRNIERGIVFDPVSVDVDWWTAPGRILAVEPAPDAHPAYLAPEPGSLKIVQGTHYDPGQAAYRFHSAINEHTKHASAFVRFGDSNPYCSLRQYDGDEHRGATRKLVFEADVVHCHMDYKLIQSDDLVPTGLIVRHYHGSRFDGTTNVQQYLDDLQKAVQVGARLSLLDESPRMQWLPIAIPMQRYRSLKKSLWKPNTAFRVAHSPTKRSIKGTEAFLSACMRLQQRGIIVIPVLIENLEHGAALAMKATCDATFDSFWLGIQGSGLEGAAMGQPVIAGDPQVRSLYERHIGYIPYTYADSQGDLEDVLARLTTDEDYRSTETKRVVRYVKDYHDYPVVAKRYEDILTKALGREDIRTDAVSPTAVEHDHTGPELVGISASRRRHRHKES